MYAARLLGCEGGRNTGVGSGGGVVAMSEYIPLTPRCDVVCCRGLTPITDVVCIHGPRSRCAVVCTDNMYKVINVFGCFFFTAQDYKYIQASL